MTDLLNTSEIRNICRLPQDLDMLEDPRTPTLRRVSYGIVMPAICCLGIIGNILNLVVLTRRNMRGTAYIYMRDGRKYRGECIEIRDDVRRRSGAISSVIPFNKIIPCLRNIETGSSIALLCVRCIIGRSRVPTFQYREHR